MAMPQVDNARRLDLIRSTASRNVQAARARSPTSETADVHAAISVQPHTGRRKMVAPRDEVSLAVRRGVQERRFHAMDHAANRHLRENRILGKIDSNITPFGTGQVYGILQDPTKCSADSDEQRALTRHRVSRCNELRYYQYPRASSVSVRNRTDGSSRGFMTGKHTILTTAVAPRLDSGAPLSLATP